MQTLRGLHLKTTLVRLGGIGDATLRGLHLKTTLVVLDKG